MLITGMMSILPRLTILHALHVKPVMATLMRGKWHTEIVLPHAIRPDTVIATIKIREAVIQRL